MFHIKGFSLANSQDATVKSVLDIIPYNVLCYRIHDGSIQAKMFWSNLAPSMVVKSWFIQHDYTIKTVKLTD